MKVSKILLRHINQKNKQMLLKIRVTNKDSDRTKVEDKQRLPVHSMP